MARDNALVGQDGGPIQLGWMDDITAFTLPAGNFAVVTFSGVVASSDNFGVDVINTYADTLPISGAGNLSGDVFGTVKVLKGKATAAINWKSFRKNDSAHPTTVQFYDYQAGTLNYGLVHSAGIRGSATGHGLHTQEVRDSAREIIIQGLMAEFGWDHATADGNIGYFKFVYDTFVETGIAPPGVDPALWDGNAVTTLVTATEHGLTAYRNGAVVLSLASLRAERSTEYTVTLEVPDEPAPGGGYKWIASCATYKKKPGTSTLTPNGWSIDSAKTYPTYAGIDWHVLNLSLVQTNAPFNGNNFFKPDLAEDFKEVTADLTHTVVTGATVSFTINLKTLKMTASRS